MRLLCIVFIVLCVSIGQAQSINLPSGSTALAVVSPADSLRIWNAAINFRISQGYIFRATDTLRAFNNGAASKVCPPSGYTKAQVDSAAQWGLNQPIDTCYYKNQLGQVFKYGRLP